MVNWTLNISVVAIWFVISIALFVIFLFARLFIFGFFLFSFARCDFEMIFSAKNSSPRFWSFSSCRFFFCCWFRFGRVHFRFSFGQFGMKQIPNEVNDLRCAFINSKCISKQTKMCIACIFRVHFVVHFNDDDRPQLSLIGKFSIWL